MFHSGEYKKCIGNAPVNNRNEPSTQGIGSTDKHVEIGAYTQYASILIRKKNNSLKEEDDPRLDNGHKVLLKKAIPIIAGTENKPGE